MAKTVTRGKSQRRVAVSISPLFSPGSPATSGASTLSEKVYRAFKRDIIHSVYQPGEALSEKALADRYKGSRTPVREAAVRLQNERLLRIVPNRGYFVAQITLQVLNDIYEFRCAVECAAAELAAMKGVDAESLRKLSELSQVTCSADDRESCVKFIESDTAFHVMIARLSRNQMLVQAVGEARSQMERIMFAAIDINYYGEAPGREHREILKAIQERDPEGARQRMYEHIIQSKDKVLGLTGFASRRS
ncbi:MAG: GntR family transcriptional regulator [Candidatus Acidiferrales bacterium]